MSDEAGDQPQVERRKNVELSEAQLDEIAKLAAAKVIEQVQLEVGKSAIRALLYVGGAIVAAAMAWLTAHGYIIPADLVSKK